MARKGQKFNKISLETKLEICKKHFDEYIPETPLSREYKLPIGTIRYIFNNYKKGYGFKRKRGKLKRDDLTKEDYKERYEILKKYQAFLKAQREKK